MDAMVKNEDDDDVDDDVVQNLSIQDFRKQEKTETQITSKCMIVIMSISKAHICKQHH